MTKTHYKIMRSPDETPLLRDKPRSSLLARSAAATLGDRAIRRAFWNRVISRRTLSMNLVTDGACRFRNPQSPKYEILAPGATNQLMWRVIMCRNGSPNHRKSMCRRP